MQPRNTLTQKSHDVRIKTGHVPVSKLADEQDLGSYALKACGFKSHPAQWHFGDTENAGHRMYQTQ